jgi:hypothetical protein
MSRLDPWRNGLEPPKGEDADRILQANFDEQAKFNDKIGLYLVGEAKAETEQAVTSTSYVAWKDMKISAPTNGGLVQVLINAQVLPSGNYVRARLLVNGQEKRTWSVGTSTRMAPGWTWTGSVGEGQNVFSLEAKVSGGTGYLQDNNGNTDPTTSYMQVLEFTKG